MQIEDLRAASNWLCPFGLRLRRNRTPSGKVHELKARETSQEPSALGQMLRKNPFAKLRFALRFGLAALACSQSFALLSGSGLQPSLVRKSEICSPFRVFDPHLFTNFQFALRLGSTTLACVLPQMGFPGSSSRVEDRIQEGICWV